MTAYRANILSRMAARLLIKIVGGGAFNARHWSNERLRVIGAHAKGAVINVSGGDDSDKQGGHYRDYFPAASGYRVSNFGDLAGLPGEFALDLEAKTVPQGLAGGFDLVFSHTVLEHVFQIEQAISNICALSRDAVLTVVPFIQSYHADAWYGDYWRFSPTAMARLFERHGFSTVFLEWNEDPLGNIYVVHLGARDPLPWRDVAKLGRVAAHGPGVARNALIFGSAGIDKARIRVR